MTNDGRFYPLQDRNQEQMFAPSLRQLVAEEAEVLALDAAVEQLDLSALEAQYRRVGHPAYHPKVMLKVLIYGYAMGMRSSRQLERACKKDDDFRFLAHGLKPDHVSLCRFRHDRLCQLKELFVQTVRLCQAAGLVTLGHVAVDGTKVRANRSAPTLGQLQQALTQALEQAEQEEAGLLAASEAASQSAEECRLMKTQEGIKPAYNGQIAVDSAHQVIVAQELLTAQNDMGQLPTIVAQVKENCQALPAAVSADGGYCAQASVEEVERAGSTAYLPLPKTHGGNFEWVAEEQAYRCPQGHWLRPYRQRRGKQLYRTHRCGGCPRAALCGVKGRFKEMVVPLPDSAVGRLAERMRTEQGQAIYAARKHLVEPVFAWFKHNRGFRRFLLHGRGAGVEWSLMCIVHNLSKWAQVTLAGSGLPRADFTYFGQRLAGLARSLFGLLRRYRPRAHHRWERLPALVRIQVQNRCSIHHLLTPATKL